MVTYDLKESTMFVRYGPAGLETVKVKKTDQVYLWNSSLEVMDAIIVNGVQGASNSTDELKVFDGRVTAKALPGLMTELQEKKMLVNCDGYCYIWVAGSRLSTTLGSGKYMRLNDLFNWDEFIDSPPAGQTKFTPPPSTTVWNRKDYSDTIKVDYEKLDADLKQAKDDKKKAEDDKKKADEDKKKAEDDKKKAEIDKKRAEDDKKRAEDAKKKAEDDKKRAEDDKKRAENDKKRAEDDKKKAENDKKRAEDDKKKAENDKKRAEDDKKKAENDKKRAEDDKKRAENDKKRAEDDKKKAENDKKRAEDDKKKAEDDKKRAENDKKKAEDDKKKAENDYRDLYNRLARMKGEWDNAVAIGCLPLHSSAFYISKTPKPRQDVIFSRTWMGNNSAFLTTPPGTLSGNDKTIQQLSLVIYNSDDYFEKHFWWVAKMYFKKYPANNYLIAFSGNGVTENSFDGQIFADKLTCGTYKFSEIYWDVDTIVIKQL